MNRFLTVLSASALLFCAPVSQAEGALNDAQKADVNQLIEAYIKENPQVMIDSLEAYQTRQQEEADAKAAEKLDDHENYLLDSKDLPRVGNPEGDVQIVEFYDYNCGYCKRAFNDIQILLEADKNVQVTFVEMPILSKESLEAAKWSLAASKQGKFFEFHSALMKFSGQKSEETLRTLAQVAELNPEALEKAAQAEDIQNIIEKNIEVARDVGIRGTPGFIVNGQIFRGYLGYEGLKAVIDETRNKDKSEKSKQAEE